MKKVFLDSLPRRGESSDINWKKSIGLIIPFEYDDIIGELKIISLNVNERINVQYQNNNYSIKISQLRNSKIAFIIGKPKFDYEYKIDQIIENNISKIKITELINMSTVPIKVIKGYKYECLNCGYVGDILEDILKNHHNGCPVCAGKIVVRDINDMWTTNKNLAKLLLNPNDGYLYTQLSDKKVDWKCPDCGEIIKDRYIYNINRQGLSCPSCGDKRSFPFKVMYSVLNMLNTDFETEKKFKWAQNKFYDFYLPNKNTIIEVHGIQHYEASFSRQQNFRTKRTIEEEQENDKVKEQLAKENGYNYIIIDARKSEVNFIKNNIINSELNNLFDLSQVDFIKCGEIASKSLIKVVCDLWNESVNNTFNIISKKMKLSYPTIRKYLNQGTELGWCRYNGVKRKVINITTNKIFNSITEAGNFYNIDFRNIHAVCKGKCKRSGGYEWSYYND